MTLETLLIQQPREHKTSKYYIYFDEWSGKINAVTNKLKENLSGLVMETTDPIAAEIMTGIKNIKKFVVADLVDGYKLVESENYLRLKQTENYLSKIPKILPSQSRDLNVVTYLKDYKLEVNVSTDLINTHINRQNNTIKLDRNDNYDNVILYIVEKNNPLRLLETITIDPANLVEHGYILYDLSHLQTLVAFGNIDILTRRIFKSYGLKVKQNYVTLDYGFSRLAKKNHIDIQGTDTEYATFSISKHSNSEWRITSNFENPHEHKIYKDIKVFLTGKNPNILLDKLIIPYDHIGDHKEFFIDTTVDPTNCKILVGEEGKNISFKIEETTND